MEIIPSLIEMGFTPSIVLAFSDNNLAGFVWKSIRIILTGNIHDQKMFNTSFKRGNTTGAIKVDPICQNY